MPIVARAGEGGDQSLTIKVPSADMGHITKQRHLPAAWRELVHPEWSLMLQGNVVLVESEVHVVVEQEAEGEKVRSEKRRRSSPQEVGGFVGVKTLKPQLRTLHAR